MTAARKRFTLDEINTIFKQYQFTSERISTENKRNKTPSAFTLQQSVELRAITSQFTLDIAAATLEDQLPEGLSSDVRTQLGNLVYDHLLYELSILSLDNFHDSFICKTTAAKIYNNSAIASALYGDNTDYIKRINKIKNKLLINFFPEAADSTLLLSKTKSRSTSKKQGSKRGRQEQAEIEANSPPTNRQKTSPTPTSSSTSSTAALLQLHLPPQAQLQPSSFLSIDSPPSASSASVSPSPLTLSSSAKDHSQPLTGHSPELPLTFRDEKSPATPYYGLPTTSSVSNSGSSTAATPSPKLFTPFVSQQITVPVPMRDIMEAAMRTAATALQKCSYLPYGRAYPMLLNALTRFTPLPPPPLASVPCNQDLILASAEDAMLTCAFIINLGIDKHGASPVPHHPNYNGFDLLVREIFRLAHALPSLQQAPMQSTAKP